MISGSHDLVAAARERCTDAATVWAASHDLLDRADPSIGVAVRAHLEAAIDADRLLAEAPAALLASQTIRERSFIDEVLEQRVGSVAHVDGGARSIARAMIEQPRVVVLLDDLVRPSPIVSALLLRSLAPATVVIVVSDHPLVLDDARRVAVATSSELSGASELHHSLDVLLA